MSVAPTPIRLTLSRERMAVFATVASHESRELVEVLGEALAEVAGRWTRTRHTLLLDPRDRALLDDYLDSLARDGDRLERLEEEAAYRAATTPAMHAAALASDERERRRTVEDDHTDLLHRSGMDGDTHVCLAIED